jgi:hypothetical protein
MRSCLLARVRNTSFTAANMSDDPRDASKESPVTLPRSWAVEDSGAQRRLKVWGRVDADEGRATDVCLHV